MSEQQQQAVDPAALAAQAIARAKAIAAQLASSSSIPNKRPNDDGESPSKKKPRVETEKLRIWISTSHEKPPPHFTQYLPPRFDELIAQVTQKLHLQETTDIKISLAGKGSDESKPPLPGIPEEPLHVSVEVNSSSPNHLMLAIDEVEPKVRELVSEAEQAPVQSDILVKYNAYKTVSVSSYQPSSVAQMIGKTDIALKPGFLQEVIGVPNTLVGFLIGKGGENIASMQARTQCKVQIQKEVELLPGQVDREITLQANTQQAIDACKRIIEKIIADRTQQSVQQRMTKEDIKIQEALDQGLQQLVVPVPDSEVGLVIGKQGAMIRQIQETTGAQIIVPKQSDAENMRQISLLHLQDSGNQQAKEMIEQVLANHRARNSSNGEANGTGVPEGERVTKDVPIPDKDVGLCIGRGGSVIKHMQSTCNVRIQIPSHPNPGEHFRMATLSGSADGVAKAEAMIQQIIADQSSANVMAGTLRTDAYSYQQYYGGNGAQGASTGNVQQNSAEWAAYRAAQAAATGQLQSAAAQVVAATSTPAAPVADQTYYEDYFRYEYYYGEAAARQYYGAWAPPPGTANPYGVNPNGLQPAPQAGVASAQTVGGSTTDNSVVTDRSQHQVSQDTIDREVMNESRETSRRKVSNLPAWMTKK